MLPRNSDIEGSGINTQASSDPGLSVSVAIGSTFGGDWRAEAELAYRTVDVDKISGAANSSGRVNGATLIFNGYRDFHIDSNWTPYVGAGIGLIRLDFDGVSPIGGSRVDDNDWVFAAQGIAGIGYRINERLGLFTDYRFLATTKPEFSTVAGNSVESEYREHRITIGLRWSFGDTNSRSKPQPIPLKTPVAAPDPAKTPIAAPAPSKSPEPRPVPPPPEVKATRAPIPARVPEVTQRFLLFFDWNRSSLTDDARAIVRDAVEASSQLPVTVIVAIGHADRSGPDRYNMGLSQRRAETVKAELKRLGIPVEEIVILHRGEGDPLVVTSDGVRELQNRRVEIILK